MNEEQPVTAAETTLYSRGQMWLAGVLGGPLAAAWVARRCAQHLDAPEVAKRLIWVGLGSMLILSITVSLLPTDTPNSPVLSMLFFLPVIAFFDFYLKARSAAAFESGAGKFSWWRVAGVGLAGAVATIVTGVVFLMIIPLQPLNTFEYGDNVIYFEGEATAEDARRLARALEVEGVFNPGAVWEITLVYSKRVDGLLEVHMPFAEPVENTQMHGMLRQLREALQTYYDDKKVEVHVENILGLTTLRIRE